MASKSNVFVVTVLKTLALVCLITATMCSYYSLSGGDWIKHHRKEIHGLIVYCTPGSAIEPHREGLEPECDLFSNHLTYKSTSLPSWQRSVFILSVTASIMTLLSTLLFMGSQVIQPFTYCSTVLVFILVTLASICMLVAMSIYTEKFQLMIQAGYSWGMSFAVGWAFFFVNLLSTVILFSLIMVYRRGQRNSLVEECSELTKDNIVQV